MSWENPVIWSEGTFLQPQHHFEVYVDPRTRAHGPYSGSPAGCERGGDLWKQTERSGMLAMHIAGEFPGLELEFWVVRG